PFTSQPQKTKQSRKTKRKVTEVPQPSDPIEHVADEAVNKEMDDSLTQAKATSNESSSQGTDSGGGPRCQETIGDTIAQTRSENVSKFSNDPLLAGFNAPRSGEDSLKLNELMELCTKLQQKVLDLETTKTNQAMEIDSLKKRVKKLEKKQRAKEKRNIPPTKAQQMSIMSTYLKNMDGWKLKSLKKKAFAKIQELFDKTMKKVNTFVDFRTKLVEESTKKAKAEITQEGSSKRT
nr:hypothetical protein [Tanacetum cinerariifolium]GFB95554.1 hypothetical protein [Tanacetum cinerariifolium]